MNFDLNVDNYTHDELAQMFELPENYDANTIEVHEAKLKDGILKNREIDEKTQLKTLDFLVKAKQIILKDPTKSKKVTIQEKISDVFNSNFKLQETKVVDVNEHMIQERPNKSYSSSYPSEYFAGVINPIKKKTTRKNLNIDSRFRENYYGSPATNYNIVLPMNMNNVLSMQLTSVEIPTSYYCVSKQYGNNFFHINVDGYGSALVTIPSGNYKYEGIANIINEAISHLAAPFNDVYFQINLSSLTNNGSGQMMVGWVVGSANIGTNIGLNFQANINGDDDRNTPLPMKLGWLLGFRNGIYENNENYVSEGVVDLYGPRYLYLVLDDHNNSVSNSFYSAFNSSILNKNILARITVQTTAPFSILAQNNLNLVSTSREYFGPVNIQHMNIQLLDEYGRVIDLNNMDFSFCLTLTTAYDI
jgi:hypothetical protein